MYQAFTELGTTLAVGLFLVAGAVFVLHFLFGIKIRVPFPFVDEHADRATPTRAMLLILITTTSFGLGMLMEDLSYKFSDDTISDLPDEVFPHEDFLRREFLYGKDLRRPGHAPLTRASFEKSTLAMDAFNHGLFRTAGGASGIKLQDAYDNKTFGQVVDSDTDSDLSRAANALYYVAKNTDYRQPEYFTELGHIKARVDFSRSLVFTAMVLFALTSLVVSLAVALLMLFVALGSIILCVGASRGRPGLVAAGISLIAFDPREVACLWMPLRKSTLQHIPWTWRITRLLMVVGALLVVYALGIGAFKREQKEYYRRAYGYFVTTASSDATRPDADKASKSTHSGDASSSPTLINVSQAKENGNRSPLGEQTGTG